MTIKMSLAIATSTLLGLSSLSVSAQNILQNTDNDQDSINNKAPTTPNEPTWKVESSLLSYSESGRISVFAPIVSIRRQLDEKSSISARFLVDSITGASPNGATISTKSQTFNTYTGASGGSKTTTYSTPAYVLPIHESKDKRAAFSFDWDRPLTINNEKTRSIYSAFVSSESDYQSIGGGVVLTHEFNDKHTTVTGGASLSLDKVSPNTIPTPLSLISANLPIVNNKDDKESENEGKTKNNVDLMLGVTQVLNRRALMQVNYSLGKSTGYLTDPYKIISVINPVDGSTVDYRYESRPDSRLRQSILIKGNYSFDHDVVYASYRYYWDDWSVRAHTFDLQYRLEFTPKFYLQPRLRYSWQTAANFYRHSLVNGTLPQYASADYRLGKMTTQSLGLKFAWEFTKNQDINIRFESIRQKGESHPANAIGVQKEVDLFPSLRAKVWQLSYSISF